MCKLIMIPNASKIVDFDHFSRYCAEILSDMSDGYGYVATGIKGQFGLKTLSPNSYAYGVEIPEFCESNEQSFGEVSQITGSALFHGRISTNTVDLLNTHPITRNEWHLIHNGVVTHHGEPYETYTSNDSEHVLYNLITGGIKKMGDNLTGYYAGGAIEPNGTLHVFKDSIAGLYYAYSEKLESPIFATNEELIDMIGDYLGESLDAIKVKDNTYLVYNGSQLVSYETFESRGYDKHSAALASKSLGVELSPIDELDTYQTYSDDCPSYKEDFYDYGTCAGDWKRKIG